MNKSLQLALATAATVTAFASHAAAPAYLDGDMAPVSESTRVITIDSNTQMVNVSRGETVKFVVDGSEFAIRFDGSVSSFDLANLAPAGSLNHKVVAYVAATPDQGGV